MMNRLTGLLVFTGLLSASCVPWVSDVARQRHPIADSSSLFPDSGHALVFPIWVEKNDECNVRRPFVLPVSSLDELHDNVPSRRMLGLMGLDGHGPSHWRGITGFAVLGAKGRVVWAHQSGARVVGTVSEGELSTLLADLRDASIFRSFERLQKIGPHTVRDVFLGMSCEQSPLGLTATTNDRLKAITFVELTLLK